MDIDEYKRLRDMLNEAIDTGRPIERRLHGGEWKPLEVLGVATAKLRVQPAPPQPKYRPMTIDELEQETCRGTIVRGKTRSGERVVVGPLVMWSGVVTICGWEPDFATLTYANPAHPKYGQPLQVLIEE